MPTVLLPRLLDPATGGRRRLDIPAGSLGELMDGLGTSMPTVLVHLFDERGTLRPHVLCFVDGEPTRLEDRSAPLHPSTEIRFVQAVSGG